MGEFFRAVLAGKSDEELVKTASFYDYLEVQPLCNNAFLINDDKYGDITSMEDLKRLNRKVIEIGENQAGLYVQPAMLISYFRRSRYTGIFFLPNGTSRERRNHILRYIYAPHRK